MYEAFFGMGHTPFVRNIPPEKLYESDAFRETLGRLCYVADRQMFAVVTADPGCGKSTLIRSANVKHFFTLLGKMFFTSYGKEFFTYPGKQIFTLYGKYFFT